MSRPNLLIVVPVHEEAGWVSQSPGEAAKARLEATSPKSKSPEDLKAACEKADEKAKALREIHLAAVKAKAARDLERVNEAERRRRRIEAAEKQKIVEKAAALEKRINDKKSALEAEAAEKRARREALREAFFASRANIAAAAAQRDHQLIERQGNAAAKRTKLLQAVQHKANYEVKHALAVATAAKEKERTMAEQASANLEERLAAASSRRTELRESPPKSSPKSPKNESTKKSSRERAKQVFQVLNDEAVALEQKRKALATAMDKALASRNARIEATVRRASAYKEKAARARAALEAKQASAGTLAHQIVDKSHAATVRRQLLLTAALRKKATPLAFDVELDKRAGVAPPAGLIARLSKPKKTLLPSELSAILMSSTARRERHLFTQASKLAARAALRECAAARRMASLAASKAKLVASEAALALRVEAVKQARLQPVLKAALRRDAAAAKRAAAALAAGAVLEAKAQRLVAAEVRRAEINLKRGQPQRVRAAAVAAKRSAFDADVKAKGEQLRRRQEGANSRRASRLSARVCRAKMSTLVRSAAVKIVQLPDGKVECVVTPQEELSSAAKAFVQPAADAATASLDKNHGDEKTDKARVGAPAAPQPKRGLFGLGFFGL